MLRGQSARPPLVLLPGTLCDERVFRPLLLGVRRRLEPEPLDAAVMMTAHCPSMREAAEHVLHLAPERFALVGFSLGGILALELALLAPERVVGMALLNVNAGPAPLDTHAARREAVLQARVLGHGRYVRQELWTNYVGAAAQGDTPLQQLLADMAQALGHEAFDAQTEAALCRRDYRPLLAGIAVPTLVVAGEEDAVCPAAKQRALAEAMPNARFVAIAGAGHFALLEQQDAVAASVAAWFHDLSGGHHAPQRMQEKM